MPVYLPITLDKATGVTDGQTFTFTEFLDFEYDCHEQLKQYDFSKVQGLLGTHLAFD